jgi:hypothetical protein
MVVVNLATLTRKQQGKNKDQIDETIPLNVFSLVRNICCSYNLIQLQKLKSTFDQSGLHLLIYNSSVYGDLKSMHAKHQASQAQTRRHTRQPQSFTSLHMEHITNSRNIWLTPHNYLKYLLMTTISFPWWLQELEKTNSRDSFTPKHFFFFVWNENGCPEAWIL